MLSALRRYAPRPAVEERCELCSVPLRDRHDHLVDLEREAVGCACRACAILFEKPGAARARYRTIPTRVLEDPAFAPTRAQWAELEIPVGLAFVTWSSRRTRWIARYPGPAGVVESELPLAGFGATEGALVRAIAPDVESLLVHAPRGEDRLTCLLVPLTAGHELAARLRKVWTGMDGGPGARREIEAFLAALRARARRLEPG